MIRNLKALGLSLIAVVALVAIGASAAQATNVTTTSGKYNARLTVKNKTNEHGKLIRLTIGAGARYIECTTSTLSGTIEAPTTKVTATAPAVGQPFDDCFSNGLTAVPATVTMNGCDLSVEATSKTTAAGAVICKGEGSKFIEVHIYESKETHEKNKPMCAFMFGEQTPTSKTTLEGTAEQIDGVAAFSNITVENTVGSAALCGVAAGKTGTASLNNGFIITGEKDEAGEVPTGIMLE